MHQLHAGVRLRPQTPGQHDSYYFTPKTQPTPLILTSHPSIFTVGGGCWCWETLSWRTRCCCQGNKWVQEVINGGAALLMSTLCVRAVLRDEIKISVCCVEEVHDVRVQAAVLKWSFSTCLCFRSVCVWSSVFWICAQPQWRHYDKLLFEVDTHTQIHSWTAVILEYSDCVFLKANRVISHGALLLRTVIWFLHPMRHCCGTQSCSAATSCSAVVF